MQSALLSAIGTELDPLAGVPLFPFNLSTNVWMDCYCTPGRGVAKRLDARVVVVRCGGAAAGEARRPSLRHPSAEIYEPFLPPH